MNTHNKKWGIMEWFPISVTKKYNIIAMLVGCAIYILTKIGIYLSIRTPGILASLWDLVYNSYTDIFVGQISLSFIVPSLLTVLGDKSETVLWQNIIKYKLIEPQNRSFKDIINYIFASVLFSFISILLNNPFMLSFYFSWNIFCLMWMTSKMVDVYFDKDDIRKEIIACFEKDTDEEKRNKIATLLEYTFSYIDANKYTLVEDSITFINGRRNEYMEELIAVVDYVRKVNEEKYWEYVKKYELQSEEKIKTYTIETCIDMIRNHRNNSLLIEIIKNTFTSKGIKDTLRDIEDYEELEIGAYTFIDQKTVLKAQSDEQQYKRLVDFLTPSIENLNHRFNSIEYNFPVDIMCYAVWEKNIEAFDYILDYMVMSYDETKEMIKKSLEQSFSRGGNAYFEVPFSDYGAFSLIINIYKSQIAVRCLKEDEVIRINGLLSDSGNKYFILDAQRKKLEKIIQDINYSSL